MLNFFFLAKDDLISAFVPEDVMTWIVFCGIALWLMYIVLKMFHMI